jgi:RNA polymerase sigma-70 factor, ECF subfamily
MRCDEGGASPKTADFRRASARLVAALTAAVGPARLDLAEDAAQDALLRALKVWPVRGEPEDPEGWLVTAARRALIDRLRRERGGAEKAAVLAKRFDAPAPSAWSEAADRDEPVRDDALRLLFLCCRPELTPETRVALALKECCGFGVSEIAAALRVAAPAVAQRLVRAKRRLREIGAAFETPPAAELPERLDDVREVIYALFNEGWRATAGAALVREDLVTEALRLARILAASPQLADPPTRALLALLCLHAARLPARRDREGAFLSLIEQDRSRFDRALLNEGFAAFEASLEGARVSRFHIEASIASLHATAPSFAATDWGAILDRYDALHDLAPGPIVELNRVVATAMAGRLDEARRDLERTACDPRLRGDGLVAATRAFLCERGGDARGAAEAWVASAKDAANASEREYCLRRAAAAARRPPASDTNDA